MTSASFESPTDVSEYRESFWRGIPETSMPLVVAVQMDTPTGSSVEPLFGKNLLFDLLV